MRVATFEAGIGENRIEIVVSAFPGRAGGLLANVNRWRGQLHLEPLTETDVRSHLEPLPDGPVQGFTLDITSDEPTTNGESPQRIVGAIINGRDGMTWFVKAMDRLDNLDPHKDAIVQFAQSFRVAGPVHSDQQVHEHNHDQPAHREQTDTANSTVWQKPSHWHTDPNPSTVLSAAFHIEGADGIARVTVTVLVGDGGGALPNINRWRHQLGLPPVNNLDDQPTTRIGGQTGPVASMTDLISTDGSRRMLVVMLPQRGRAWFYKMTGPDAVVEKEKQAFEQFVLANRPPQTHP